MKKWSYAAAMMLALAGGSIFTGCIDNDEPFGLQAVRLATADLLKAKAVAAEAEKAAKEVELEIAKMQAEVEKMYAEAELERIKSEERINQITAEAAAAKDQAEAQKILAQADSIRTAAQAMYEATQADIKNKRDIVDKKLEFADQKLAELKYDFAQSQLKDADCRKSKLYCLLEGAYQDYIWTLEQYNSKLNEIAIAEAELDKAKVDLKWIWNAGVDKDGKPSDASKGGYWSSPKYDTVESFNNLIANYNKQKECLNDAITLLEEANQKLEAIQDSELFTLLEDYTNAENDLNLNLAQLQVEKDAIRINNPDVFDAADAAYKVIADSMDRKHPIPAYTFKPTADLAALGMTKDKVVVAENQTYKLQYKTDEDGNPTSEIVASENYENAETRYKGQIARVKNFLMDDFDKAWTEASKNEIKNELTAANATYAAAEAAWKQAKGVYNMGQTPVIPANFPYEADYETAMNAFNSGVAGVTSKIKAYGDAYMDWSNKVAAYDAALKNFEESNPNTAAAVWQKAIEDRREAYNKADSDYQAALNTATEVEAEGIAKLDAQEDELRYAAYNAQNVLNKLNAELVLSPDSKDLKDQITAMQKEYDAAKAAYDKFVLGTPAQGDKPAVAPTKATQAAALGLAHQKADAAAATAKAKAEKAADEAYFAAKNVWDNSDAKADYKKDPEYKVVADAEALMDAAEAAKDSAHDVLDAAAQALNATYTSLVTAFNNQNAALGTDMYKSYPEWQSVNDYLWNNGAKPSDAVKPMMLTMKLAEEFDNVSSPFVGQNAATVYINAKNYVIQMSAVAFGNLDQSNDPMEYQDQAVLVDAVTPAMINDYIAKNYYEPTDPEPSLAECYQYYREFGAYGQTLYLQSRLDVADAMLANSDLAESNIAAMQANLAVMTQSLTNAKAGLEKVKDAYDKAADAVDDLYTEVDEKIYLAQQLVKPYEQIVRSLQNAVNIYYANETDKTLDKNQNAQEAVKSAIESNNKYIAFNQAWLEGVEKALDRAEYQQNQLQAGIANAEADSTQQIALDKLNAEADVLKQNVDFYLTRVQDLTKAYEDALGKTAE